MNSHVKPSKLNKTEKRGFFITFEGGEGAGKSTQIQNLADKLNETGFDVVLTREPGGSKGAEAIRHVILSGAAESFGAEMEAILFSAARADHVDSIIEPSLESGKIVICDRFYDSTRVYQGVGGKVDAKLLYQLEDIACKNIRPDLTIIIDLDPEIGMKRANTRRTKGSKPDRFEKEALSLQKKRRNAFLKIAKDEPDRCVIVNGEGSGSKVFERIWKAVENRLTITPDKATNPAMNKRSNTKPKLVSHKKLIAKKQQP